MSVDQVVQVLLAVSGFLLTFFIHRGTRSIEKLEERFEKLEATVERGFDVMAVLGKEVAIVFERVGSIEKRVDRLETRE